MGFLNAYRIKVGSCLVAMMLCTGMFAPTALANKGQPKMTEKAAAAEAQRRHGGRVLKVKSSSSGTSYQVKLLLDSGRVKVVEIEAR